MKGKLDGLLCLFLIISGSLCFSQEVKLGLNMSSIISKGYFIDNYKPIEASLYSKLEQGFSYGLIATVKNQYNSLFVGYQFSSPSFGIHPTQVDTYMLGMDTLYVYLGGKIFGVEMDELSIGFSRTLPITQRLYFDLNLSVAAVRNHITKLGQTETPLFDSMPGPGIGGDGRNTKYEWRLGVYPGMGMGLGYKLGRSTFSIDIKYKIRQRLLDSRGVYTMIGINEYEYARYGYYGDYLRIGLSYSYAIFRKKKE